MLSDVHEILRVLFRNNSKLAPELLQGLHADLPNYREVRIESANLTDLRPAEYRADLVLLLMGDARPAVGIVVEIQLSVDRKKQYTWPAYVANLRARIRCPVYLLVITNKEKVARWARKPIELGGNSRITPWVTGPENTPAVTDLQQAKEDVELAVLSAHLHGSNTDAKLATHIVNAAVMANATVDVERREMYLHLIFKYLPKRIKQELTKMDTIVREYLPNFTRRYLEGKAEGIAEGKAKGIAELTLRLLTDRFGPQSEAIQARIRKVCSEQQSDRRAVNLLKAETLEQMLSLLRRRSSKSEAVSKGLG